MRLLMYYGADPKARDSQNRTPLHWIIMADIPDIIEILLNAGAIVDARNSDQYTPLLLAMKMRLYQSAKMLISKGASIGW